MVVMKGRGAPAARCETDLVVGVESDGDVISLANGCVCCNIRDDLLAAVQQVIERRDQPEYIVLEASGVAESVRHRGHVRRSRAV